MTAPFRCVLIRLDGETVVDDLDQCCSFWFSARLDHRRVVRLPDIRLDDMFRFFPARHPFQVSQCEASPGPAILARSTYLLPHVLRTGHGRIFRLGLAFYLIRSPPQRIGQDCHGLRLGLGSSRERGLLWSCRLRLFGEQRGLFVRSFSSDNWPAANGFSGDINPELFRAFGFGLRFLLRREGEWLALLILMRGYSDQRLPVLLGAWRKWGGVEFAVLQQEFLDSLNIAPYVPALIGQNLRHSLIHPLTRELLHSRGCLFVPISRSGFETCNLLIAPMALCLVEIPPATLIAGNFQVGLCFFSPSEEFGVLLIRQLASRPLCRVEGGEAIG